MSAEHGERNQSELRDVMALSLRELLERNSNLAQRVFEALKDGDFEEIPPEVIAALQITEEFSRASRVILEAQGQAIFAKAKTKAPELEDESDQEVSADKPRTFGELLRAKIEEALPNYEIFTRGGLVNFLKNKRGVKRTLLSQNLSKEKKLTREEAIGVVQKFLVTASGNFSPRESYNQNHILQSFRLPKDKLDEWSQEIGYDWQDRPTLDHKTAMQIRGLDKLERILGKR